MHTMKRVVGHDPQAGFATLAVMALLVLLTGLGISALTITSMDNTQAGFARTNDAAIQAAEACVETGVKVLQVGMSDPGILGAMTTTTGGPVNPAKAGILGKSIRERGYDTSDLPTGPNADLTMNFPSQVAPLFNLTGDIDRITMMNAEGGDATKKDANIYYEINCVATDILTQATTNVRAEYKCLKPGGTDACQRQPT